MAHQLYRYDGTHAPAGSKVAFWRPSEIGTWAVETQDRRRIQDSPLVPSLVLDTGSSYQVHFVAKSPLPENRRALVDHRLAPHFQADVSDLMLAPPAARILWRHEVSYTEQQIAQSFRFRPLVPTRPLLDHRTERAFVAALISSPDYFDDRTAIGLPALADFHALRAYEALVNVLSGPDEHVTRAAVRAQVSKRADGGDCAWFDSFPVDVVPYDLVVGWAAQIQRFAALRMEAVKRADEEARVRDQERQAQQDEIDEIALRDVA